MSPYFRHESLQDRETTAKYLNVLIESLKNGNFSYINDKEEVNLKINGKIKFEIKAKKKEKSTKIFVKLEWYDNPDIMFHRSPLMIESGE